MKTKAGTITVHVSLKVAARGGRKLFIVDKGTEAVVAEPPLENPVVRSLATAFRWRAMLERDQYSSIPELARAQRVKATYVYRMLRLTLLAPSLVDRILNGEMRCSVSTLLMPLPILWSDQCSYTRYERR